jgi:hypothetical protein
MELLSVILGVAGLAATAGATWWAYRKQVRDTKQRDLDQARRDEERQQQQLQADRAKEPRLGLGCEIEQRSSSRVVFVLSAQNSGGSSANGVYFKVLLPEAPGLVIDRALHAGQAAESKETVKGQAFDVYSGALQGPVNKDSQLNFYTVVVNETVLRTTPCDFLARFNTSAGNFPRSGYEGVRAQFAPGTDSIILLLTDYSS